MAVPARRNPINDAVNNYPNWSHPDVLRNANDWRMIRDCIEGERAVKDRTTVYLPQLEDQENDEYAAYLDRAVFYNMVRRTVRAMVGVAFRRTPKIADVPERWLKPLSKATYENISLELFVKQALEEVVTMGRYGILVELDREGKKAPYFAGYTAESILDWETMEIDGRQVLSGVVLRHIRYRRAGVGTKREVEVSYRMLSLDWDESRGRFIYVQRIYAADQQSNVDLSQVAPVDIITPTRNGVPLDFIPFVMPGAFTTSSDVDQSPVKDICSLNLSHYRSYADLEHGRFYCGMPVYTVTTNGNQGGEPPEYSLGPNKVWRLDGQGKASILEFNGQGLTFLERACLYKEDQIATLGGRLLGGQARSVAESDNQLKIKESSEQTILHNVVLSMNDAMTTAVRWWLWWAGEENFEEAEIAISTEFMTDMFGARELRAIHQMYKDGVIPAQVFHSYMQKADVIPDWLDLDMFLSLMDDERQFPNMPDILARMRGYPDKKSWIAHREKLREFRIREREVDLTQSRMNPPENNPEDA